jgi:acetyl esterase/lipase
MRRRTCVLIAMLTVCVGAAAPAHAAQGVDVITGVAYAPPEPAGSEGHLLDLYLPRGARHPRPLVIWSQGSGWLAENGRSTADMVAAQFNPAGFAVAGVSVRSSTNAQFPAQVHDINAAVRFLRKHARRYGLDPRRIGVMGDSSGGWTATMAGLTGDVRAVVDLYGPTDFLRMDEEMIDCPFFNELFGLSDCHNDPLSPESLLVGCPIQSCPGAAQRANPIRYVGRRNPPFLIVHGQADLLVPHDQSVRLYRALKRACSDATFYSLPLAGHSYALLSDPSLTAGQIRHKTRGCGREHVSTRARPVQWDTLIAFMRRELGGRHRRS